MRGITRSVSTRSIFPWMFLKALERFHPVHRFHDLASQLSQTFAQILSNLGFVLDHQNPSCRR